MIVRVVSLACDTPTGPALHNYISKYVYGYQSNGVHKDAQLCLQFTFRGDNYITNTVRLSLLHVTCLLVILFIPTNITKLSQTV